MFVEEYSKLLQYKPDTMRTRVRNSLLDVLSKVAFTNSRVDELLQKPRVQFLYIHHVFNDEIVWLEKLLKHLSKHHTFISYSDAVNKIWNGNIDKPYICISSDDGLKNNLTAGKILREHGISACFFICPSMIGVTDAKQIAEFANERLHFPPVEFLTWKEVESLQSQGHDFYWA